jgi:hypothetical protein
VTATSVQADLTFSVDVPGEAPVTGSLEGAGSRLVLRVSDPAAFAGGADAAGLRRVADELHRLGVAVQVRDSRDVPLLTMGAVRPPWWQRPLTRSPHLQVAGLRGLAAAGRGRARGGEPRLPGAGLAPPATPYPLAPTFLRRPVRRVTTTHDPARGGLPRLIELPADGLVRSDDPVHWLQKERTLIGSDPACDVVLPGLAPIQAEVRQNDADEFTLVALDPDTRVHGERIFSAVLRTAARIELGPEPRRVLTFVREEYADHGRPYGGRIGGELGHQRSQPTRRRAQERADDSTTPPTPSEGQP